MISLIQLEYIVAVDSYRHFATAAENCFVTQPTLSMQVKKLEEELDVLVFDRSKQPVVPTVSGKRVIAQARNILEESKKLAIIARESKNEVSGNLKIGIIPTIAPYLLPRFSGSFRRNFPKVTMKVQEMVTDQIIETLMQGLIDVGILVTPIDEKGIFEHPLYYEEILIYSSIGHPYLQKKSIDVKQMNTDDIWLLNDGHCFRHQVVNLCDIHLQASVSLPFEFEGGNIDTLIKIIDKEGGYTLIPELTYIDLDEHKKLQVRTFKSMAPLREVSLVFTRRYEKTRLMEELAKEIRASVSDKMLQKDRGTLVKWRT